MRTDIWYGIGGFIMLSWLLIGIAAAAQFGKVQKWITYTLQLGAAGMSCTAGAYAAQDTWIEDLFVWVTGLHPVILLFVGLSFVVLVVQLAKAAVPDNFMSYIMTTPLIVLAFWLPLLAEHAVPPGQVGDLTEEASTTVSTALVDSTSGWFGGQGSTDKGKGNTGQGSVKGGPR